MDTKNKLLKLNGIILKETNYNEYDKLLTVLTKEKGKIQIYAFGVRKQNSKNIGKLRFLTFLTFEVREIKEKYQLENAILLESFDVLSTDYEKVCIAYYFIELIDYFSFENIEYDAIYELMYYALLAMKKSQMDIEIIRRVFELKMFLYEGIYKESSKVPLKLKYTWDYIIDNKVSKVFSFNLNEELKKLLSIELDIEMREKVGKKFRTLEILKREI